MKAKGFASRGSRALAGAVEGGTPSLRRVRSRDFGTEGSAEFLSAQLGANPLGVACEHFRVGHVASVEP